MFLLCSCGGENSEPEPPPSGIGNNESPMISGAAPVSVIEGSQYQFSPTASDPDSDSLTYSASGLPGWAAFDPSTGSVTGSPSAADLGTYDSIVISVSDGLATVSLAPFSIDVVASAVGAATVSWVPPTVNTDGTPLTALAGYKIYWGQDIDELENFVTLENPGITTYVVDQLSAGTWYFSATAFDLAGLESDFSNMAAKTID